VIDFVAAVDIMVEITSQLVLATYSDGWLGTVADHRGVTSDKCWFCE
jgi:hypothetical protein